MAIIIFNKDNYKKSSELISPSFGDGLSITDLSCDVYLKEINMTIENILFNRDGSTERVILSKEESKRCFNEYPDFKEYDYSNKYIIKIKNIKSVDSINDLRKRFYGKNVYSSLETFNLYLRGISIKLENDSINVYIYIASNTCVFLINCQSVEIIVP